MLIPLGHEQTSVRRLPWVTFALMGLCIVIFVLMAPGEHENQMESYIWHHQALGYFAQHPYLQMDPRFEKIFVAGIGDEQADAFAEYMRRSGPRPPEDRELLARQQRRFDSLTDSYFRCVDASLLTRFGLVPARIQAANLVTYQFLHAGVIHLGFNLLMLFVVGPFIEDVWGRPLFLAFYLVVGAGAALMFAVRYPDLQSPLIGASGAIAGVMGAFLVRYFKSKIRFVVWLGVPIGPLHAPAWIIFPLWFAFQLIAAQSLDQKLPEGGAVAFWAHVWGFALGAVFAVVMAHLSVEEKYLHRAIESKVTMVDNRVVDWAMARSDSGDFKAAASALEAELAKNPDNVDAAMALWNLCAQHEEQARALPHMVRAIERAVRKGDTLFAMNYWENLLEMEPRDTAVEPLLAVRMAEILEAERRTESAARTLKMARQLAEDGTPIAVSIRIARLALLMDDPEALAMVDFALEHPSMPAEARPELEVARWALEKRMTEAASLDTADKDSGPGEQRYLQVTVAVPIAVNDKMLSVDVKGTHRQVVFQTVKAISVVGIARAGRRPVAVIDLLLDELSGEILDPRTVRLFGDSFDPRTLVGGEDPRKAFRDFLKLMIESSGAEALPDPEAAVANPFRSFPSLESYEIEVFGVAS